MDYKDKPSLDILVDELYHYGMPRRSGRYPWGSGKEPYQHSGDFIARVDELKSQGLSESEIAETLGIVGRDGKPSSFRLRTQLSLANSDRRALQVATAEALRKDGLTLDEITQKMGFKNDSSVRTLLDENRKVRMNQAEETAKFIKSKIDEKGMIMVGSGVERELGISREKLEQALYILELEGYPTYGSRVPQATNKGKMTTLRVVCPPGTKHADIYDTNKLNSLNEYKSNDDGETFQKFVYPKSMDSKRLMIRYAEEGGLEKDGTIELRRNVPDLSLGGDRYSQVRILVDNDRYLKGMAIYSDDMPDGVDVIFNTNKAKGTPMRKVLKEIKNDPENPFGSLIKAGGQNYYVDANGKKQLGLINKRAEEGDWEDWSNKLPSQFLSKQSLSLAKKQLGLAAQSKIDEFNEIKDLTNPTVKKRLLRSFSEDCDSAAVHLHAAALPRQQYHVILPFPTMKEDEVYAPNYRDGEKVALIRYPHGGTFEIPVLTVNNKHKLAKKALGTDPTDAVGINSKVAERLSGADFDGDTVMVIPTNDKVKITSSKPLKDLEGFDPKMAYGTIDKPTGRYDEKGKEIIEYYNAKGNKIKVMNNTQNEMGRISNLITDMTIQGAKPDELARAVKHSMVVIDAEKHKLDYRTSYIDNGIDSLKKKYQSKTSKDGKISYGASTLISRAKSQESVDKRQGSPRVNMKYDKNGKLNDFYDPSKPEGALLYKKADDLYHPDWSKDKKTGLTTIRTADGKKITYDRTDPKQRRLYDPIESHDPKTGAMRYTNADGSIEYKFKKRTEKSTKMAETDDAMTLVSEARSPMEIEYAKYANKMKSLANEARKLEMTTGKIEKDAGAAKLYKEEVAHLEAQLNEALKNAPKEKLAQVRVNARMAARKQANPDMTKEEEKKYSQMELTKARNEVGAKRVSITISDKEWEAIQAGAISETKLKQILNNTDIDEIRKKATPRKETSLTTAQVSRINNMKARGLTNRQIADALGISTTTVSNYLK